MIEILSKKALTKAAALATSGSGIGASWWQMRGNIHPKALERESIFENSNTNLGDILNLSFESEEYRNMFKDGICVKKYLPGKINDVSTEGNMEDDNVTNKTIFLSADGFSGRSNNLNRSRPNTGFLGTTGCLNVNIKYNNGKNNQNKGIIGNMELVVWNDDVIKGGKIANNGYGMIMSSVISNLKGKFNFLNKLTFLKKNKGNWDVLDSAIWVDSTSKDEGKERNIAFTFGNETFSFKIGKENAGPNKLENPKEYKKLARWFQGKKENNDNDQLLGYWDVNINGKNTNLWKNLNELRKEKSDLGIPKALYYKDKWYKGTQELKYDFGHFDTYNPPKDGKVSKNNGISEYGIWVDVLEECIYKKDSEYKDICLAIS